MEWTGIPLRVRQSEKSGTEEKLALCFIVQTDVPTEEERLPPYRLRSMIGSGLAGRRR